jgi:hypothetical protein
MRDRADRNERSGDGDLDQFAASHSPETYKA